MRPGAWNNHRNGSLDSIQRGIKGPVSFQTKPCTNALLHAGISSRRVHVKMRGGQGWAHPGLALFQGGEKVKKQIIISCQREISCKMAEAWHYLWNDYMVLL